MHSEIFNPIPESNGRYVVSNMGRVFRIGGVTTYKKGGTRYFEGHELKQRKTKDGYLFVGISIKGKSNTRLVHRLVAKAFVDNLKNKPNVNHLDGNRSNNNACNLEWCTQSENVLYSYRVLGYKDSEETRKRKSDAGKTKVFTESHKRNLSLSQTGEKSHRSKPILDIVSGNKYVSLKDFSIQHGLNYNSVKTKYRNNKYPNLKQIA